jgi:hypothetical protein
MVPSVHPRFPVKFDLCFSLGFSVGVIGGIAIVFFGMSQAPSPGPSVVVASQGHFQN